MKQGSSTSAGPSNRHTQPNPRGVNPAGVSLLGQATDNDGDEPTLYNGKRGITAPPSVDVTHPSGSQGHHK